jgi:hypothetical protein
MPLLPEISLYYTDDGERASLESVKIEFEKRGHATIWSDNLKKKSELGVYAIHANRFFDFTKGIMIKPNSMFSVAMLHDFGQDNGERHRYFLNDSWETFNLGLLINEQWAAYMKQATEEGGVGPINGYTVAGYPKSDQLFRDLLGSQAGTMSARKSKRKILIACSWQNREHIVSALTSIDKTTYELYIKGFDYHSNFSADVDSPWSEVFRAQVRESVLLKEFCTARSDLVMLPSNMDIFSAISEVDLVISNGSNVMHEALLLGKPAIFVPDWLQPAGLNGHELMSSKISQVGILTANPQNLNEVIAVALSSCFESIIKVASEELLQSNLRGIGAQKTVDGIMQAYESVILEDNPSWIHPYVNKVNPYQFPTEIRKFQNEFKIRTKTPRVVSHMDLTENSIENYENSTNLPEDLSANSSSAIAERDSAVAERDSAVAERDSISSSTIWRLFGPYRKLIRFIRRI